jgi:hypothetical protein
VYYKKREIHLIPIYSTVLRNISNLFIFYQYVGNLYWLLLALPLLASAAPGLGKRTMFYVFNNDGL